MNSTESNSDYSANKSTLNGFLENRVPAIVLTYWIIKIAATTLGETGADHLSMTLGLGYASASIIFFGLFILFFGIKLLMKKFNPIIYWLVFTATSLAGTAMSDFMDRTLGLGYIGGSLILFSILLVILAIWRYFEKSLSVEYIVTNKAEAFYWLAFLIANTLGTALGDFLADTSGLGFFGGAMVISGLLLTTAILHYFTKISSVLLFWIAFVLTRPFGATFGDLLTKPLSQGGLNFGTLGSSLFFAIVLIFLIYKEFKSNNIVESIEEVEIADIAE